MPAKPTQLLAAVSKAAASIGQAHNCIINAQQKDSAILLSIAHPADPAEKANHEPIGIALAVLAEAGLTSNGIKRFQGANEDGLWLLDVAQINAPADATANPPAEARQTETH
jgi:hypothetical protein